MQAQQHRLSRRLRPPLLATQAGQQVLAAVLLATALPLPQPGRVQMMPAGQMTRQATQAMSTFPSSSRGIGTWFGCKGSPALMMIRSLQQAQGMLARVQGLQASLQSLLHRRQAAAEHHSRHPAPRSQQQRTAAGHLGQSAAFTRRNGLQRWML